MSNLTVEAPPVAPVPPRRPWAMLLSVLTDPRGTFEALRSKPPVFPPLLIFWVAATATAYVAVLKSMDLVLQRAGTAAAQSQQGADPAQLANIVKWAAYATPPFSTAFGLLVTTAVAAGILTLLGVMLSGEGGFMQVWSTYLYASVPASLIGVLVTGIMYLTAPAGGVQHASTSLAMLLPAASSGSTTYHLLSAVDPFDIWRLVLLTVGYAAVMKFSTRRSALITIPLWAVAKGIGIAMSVLALSLGKIG